MNPKRALPRYLDVLAGEEKPRFKEARENGLLRRKAKEAYKTLESCELCERKCGVNRKAGEKGFCGVGGKARISSAFVHRGEEPFISPSYTIFFMGCTFECQYCQNWTISQWKEVGTKKTPKELARMVDKHSNSKNVNYVGGEPTPNLPFILNSLEKVDSNIPMVWNSNFYMSQRSMGLLEDVVDVYLSDWKYGGNKCAKRLSKVEDYWPVVKRNHDLAFEDSELVIRHLVLPNHFECCTKPILEYISENYGDRVIVNVMAQYRPEWKAKNYEDISGYPRKEDLERARQLAKDLNLNYIK